MNMDINFPNLHIYLEHVGKNINVFGITIAYYGMIIALGMLLGVSLILHRAKKDGLDPDQCLDICIFTIIFAVIGARIYYVVFAWDYYKDNLLSVFNIRQGGLAHLRRVLAGGPDSLYHVPDQKDPIPTVRRSGGTGTSGRTDLGTLGQLLQPGSLRTIHGWTLCHGTAIKCCTVHG